MDWIKEARRPFHLMRNSETEHDENWREPIYLVSLPAAASAFLPIWVSLLSSACTSRSLCIYFSVSVAVAIAAAASSAARAANLILSGRPGCGGCCPGLYCIIPLSCSVNDLCSAGSFKS
jgi:hypothetical protein